MLEIKNSCLRASFRTLGAETRSLTDLATAREYLWQGDPHWWGGCSPILFPITGGLWNGTCRHADRELHIPKHGFASKREWEVASHESDRITFRFTPSEEDITAFPFRYELRVTYSLTDRTLRADISVLNLDAGTLYFQAGGHPAIALPDWKEDTPLDGYLRFEGEARSLLRAGEQGCIEVEEGRATLSAARRFPVPATEDGLTPLCVDTFANEALILDRQITAATVLDRERRPIARVASTAPVWLFWSPQGKHSPFVCCEPWYGLPDLQGFAGDITERPFIQCLAPGDTWHGGYTVEVFA